ncbi:hypothetical protein J6590_037559 [Homalodisca vitripennis]|nr:hypothetical protein J6590_037559 [Homalodisca vitripennis]
MEVFGSYMVLEDGGAPQRITLKYQSAYKDRSIQSIQKPDGPRGFKRHNWVKLQASLYYPRSVVYQKTRGFKSHNWVKLQAREYKPEESTACIALEAQVIEPGRVQGLYYPRSVVYQKTRGFKSHNWVKLQASVVYHKTTGFKTITGEVISQVCNRKSPGLYYPGSVVYQTLLDEVISQDETSHADISAPPPPTVIYKQRLLFVHMKPVVHFKSQ